MTEITANISLNSEQDGSNLLQRLGELQDEIEIINNHREALAKMGYNLTLSETDDGELLVEITDSDKSS